MLGVWVTDGVCVLDGVWVLLGVWVTDGVVVLLGVWVTDGVVVGVILILGVGDGVGETEFPKHSHLTHS